MESRSSPKHILGIFIFSTGILLCTVLTATMTWANFEADFYGFQRFTSDRFSGLICPILLTHHETGTILVDIKNPTEKTIDPIIRIDTSTSGIPGTKQIQLSLLPGQTQHLAQTVSADNIDLGYFIFAKAYRYASYPLPAAEATCGTLILDLPLLNGMQFYLVCLAVSLVAVPLGMWLWSWREDEKIYNASKAMAVIALAGILLSAKVGWGLGLFCLILTLLLSTVILRLVTPK
jgi:hypothetical protein